MSSVSCGLSVYYAGYEVMRPLVGLVGPDPAISSSMQHPGYKV